jgi:hypothetical protein
METKIGVLNSQISVFSSKIEFPFNDWNNTQISQEFIRRKESVSFVTINDYGNFDIEIITEAQEFKPDPVINGVSYDPFAGAHLIGGSHTVTYGNQYSINNQNSLSNKEWDGYCFVSGTWYNPSSWSCKDAEYNYKDSLTGESKTYSCHGWRGEADCIEKTMQITNQQSKQLDDAISTKGGTFLKDYNNYKGDLNSYNSKVEAHNSNVDEVNNKYKNGGYLIRNIYIPTWYDYARSSEKLLMDTLETHIAFASICKTDTVYPYGCNSFHSIIAENFDLSVSPNISAFAEYQRRYTRVWYTFNQKAYDDDVAKLNQVSDSLSTTKTDLESRDQALEKTKGEVLDMIGQANQWDGYKDFVRDYAIQSNNKLAESTINDLNNAETDMQGSCILMGIVSAGFAYPRCAAGTAGAYTALREFVKEQNTWRNTGKDIDYGKIAANTGFDTATTYIFTKAIDVATNKILSGLNNLLGAGGKKAITGCAMGEIEAEAACVPNPFGRRGGPAHTNKITEMQKLYEKKGYQLISGGSRKEQRIVVDKATGQYKYPDILMEAPDGRVIAIQVGKQNSSSNPITREALNKALLENADTVDEVIFVPYN